MPSQAAVLDALAARLATVAATTGPLVERPPEGSLDGFRTRPDGVADLLTWDREQPVTEIAALVGDPAGPWIEVTKRVEIVMLAVTPDLVLGRAAVRASAAAISAALRADPRLGNLVAGLRVGPPEETVGITAGLDDIGLMLPVTILFSAREGEL